MSTDPNPESEKLADKPSYDIDEVVAAPPEEKKVAGLGKVLFVGPRSKAKAKQQKSYGHIASADDYLDALKKLGIEAKPDDWVVYFPESRMKSIDEMLAKLHAEADAPVSSKQKRLTYKQALSLHAEVSDSDSEEAMVLIKDLEKELENIENQRNRLDQNEHHFEGLLIRAQGDFIRAMQDILINGDLDKELKDKYIESGNSVDEAKIAIPQAIEDISSALDALASAEGPDAAINALRDIISTVAGALDKLGNKTASKALSKIAMETPAEAPATATARESTTLTNI